jgi:hypothetical protein
MADNYLERRREEYERKKAEWLRKKKRSVVRSEVKVKPIKHD